MCYLTVARTSALWNGERTTEERHAVSPEDRLSRLAAWLNSGAYVPPSAVTNTQRDALLRAGLVTEATLRAHQIY